MVMGILNVTPDSFSDGGRHHDPEAAVSHGRRLIAEGADIVDVGGESTRPGALPVSELEELRRVITVIEALADEVEVSIDTVKPGVAEAAIEAGATVVNDVSAELEDVAAGHGVGWVAMHRRGDSATMQDDPHYDDVVAEVCAHLEERADRAVAAGIDRLWIDPGIGFGKTQRHNLELLAHLDRLVETGFPVAVGTSRKSSLGTLLALSDHRGRQRPEGDGQAPFASTPSIDIGAVPTDDRIEGSLATATWAVAHGVDLVRAHDVAATVQAVRIVTGDPSHEEAA
jgi:dihydropteroate synthase